MLHAERAAASTLRFIPLSSLIRSFTYRVTLRLTWRSQMERFVGIEDARSSLGRLVDEVATTGDVVALTKRGKALAVLVSRDEYAQMKLAATERARAELADALDAARTAVQKAGLEATVIDEAIAAARQL
ncbi:MAG TPA: type II toxin-antitoxin system Phd/YefM family antitoxin [Acidimicrobiales bacterium]|nr:type II toxin-antitoxin system Phd/YefM family antitoxin [Acidimicrobiales bacterium]